MPKVICTHPNASNLIDGVNFSAHPRGVISEDISEEQAKRFASIPGYEVDGQELADLRAKASDLGIDFKGNWKQDRLRAEIERAEAKMTEEEAAARKAAGDTSADAKTNGEGSSVAAGYETPSAPPVGE